MRNILTKIKDCLKKCIVKIKDTVTNFINKIKDGICNFINYVYSQRVKIYCLVCLIFGIALGCMYEGKGDDYTHYFNVFGHTFYVGWIQ